MSANPFYLSPELARENLIASRLVNSARRMEKEREAARKVMVAEAKAELIRVGWDEQAAQEMAENHVRMLEARA